VLQQQRPGQPWRPLGFFSAKLNAPQQRYSTFDRELLGVYLAIHHFRFMLEGHSFTIFTDHRPLVGALGRVSEPWTARQQRQLAFIAEFTADIQHVSGQHNIVADTLSRPPTSPPPPSPSPPGPTCMAISSPAPSPQQCAPPPVDLAQLAAAQSSCADCSSTALRVLDVKINGVDVMVDVSSGVFCPLVPRSFRRHIFDAIHGLAHPGIRATRRLIASRYVWPQLATDVKNWCNECQQCQAAKVTKQPTAATQSIAVPTTRFTHVHLDLVGPLPAAADGSTHIITMVDRSSRWAEATPLRRRLPGRFLRHVGGPLRRSGGGDHGQGIPVHVRALVFSP
jgi:cleavage and polyadenylation specificity factor subunit 1